MCRVCLARAEALPQRVGFESCLWSCAACPLLSLSLSLTVLSHFTNGPKKHDKKLKISFFSFLSLACLGCVLHLLLWLLLLCYCAMCQHFLPVYQQGVGRRRRGPWWGRRSCLAPPQKVTPPPFTASKTTIWRSCPQTWRSCPQTATACPADTDRTRCPHPRTIF